MNTRIEHQAVLAGVLQVSCYSTRQRSALVAVGYKATEKAPFVASLQPLTALGAFSATREKNLKRPSQDTPGKEAYLFYHGNHLGPIPFVCFIQNTL